MEGVQEGERYPPLGEIAVIDGKPVAMEASSEALEEWVAPMLLWSSRMHEEHADQRRKR
jgi:hypothetical protein